METPTDCDVGVPHVDDRCKDPAFAAANPDICGAAAKLIVKPNIASICVNAPVQFKAYLQAAGGEQLIETGVTFSISNQSVAIIGALSGNVTGVAMGVATVTAEWQGYIASAQLTVVSGSECCEDAAVGMVLLIDNSLSMQQAMSGFGNKLGFAKEAARQYAGDLNTTKDKMAVFRFSESGAMILVLSDNVASIQAAINSIPGSSQKTNLYDGLEEAINYINSIAALDRRVIVLLSDGENKQGADPVPLANSFISAGGVIQVVGVRAHGDGFDLLNQIASGGMFVNAYNLATGNESIHFMRNMKGYYCAGNCTPPGDTVVNKGELTFDAFTNWDVLGPVDLIGGEYPNQFFDLLPGNGLYVDTNGSGPPWLGHMRTKDPFTFNAGQQYELKVRVAGNQRDAAGTYVTKFKITGLLDEDIEPSSYQEDFTEYTFLFTPGGGASEKIEMISQSPASAFGNLWDYIRLRNVTTDTVLFEDDFDEENPTYIEPACGMAEIPEGYGEGFAYGYACYGYGCLEGPPPEQVPDPVPLPDLETV